MIIPEIHELNKDSIYRYLGSGGSFAQLLERMERERLEAQIARCTQTVLQAVRIRCVYRILPVRAIAMDHGSPDDSADTLIRLEGKDIAKLLDGCGEAVLFALTLGTELERILMRSEISNMSDAFVLDVCASVAIEEAADDFERKLGQMLQSENRYLTNRFSPGYGDLPLSHQRQLLEFLNAQRMAGITLTPTDLMVPRKSITAVMGICDHIKPDVLGGCGKCPLLTKCSYRERGTRCYGNQEV